VDEKRLFAPGRLVYMQKPQEGAETYVVYKGSIANSCNKLTLKKSMMSDHGVGQYAQIVVSGKLAAAA
jgi:hypothetical protein